MYLLALAIVQNVTKIAEVDPELWQHIIFGPKMAQSPWMIFFFEKPLI